MPTRVPLQNKHCERGQHGTACMSRAPRCGLHRLSPVLSLKPELALPRPRRLAAMSDAELLAAFELLMRGAAPAAAAAPPPPALNATPNPAAAPWRWPWDPPQADRVPPAAPGRPLLPWLGALRNVPNPIAEPSQGAAVSLNGRGNAASGNPDAVAAGPASGGTRASEEGASGGDAAANLERALRNGGPSGGGAAHDAAAPPSAGPGSQGFGVYQSQSSSPPAPDAPGRGGGGPGPAAPASAAPVRDPEPSPASAARQPLQDDKEQGPAAVREPGDERQQSGDAATEQETDATARLLRASGAALPGADTGPGQPRTGEPGYKLSLEQGAYGEGCCARGASEILWTGAVSHAGRQNCAKRVCLMALPARDGAAGWFSCYSARDAMSCAAQVSWAVSVWRPSCVLRVACNQACESLKLQRPHNSCAAACAAPLGPGWTAAIAVVWAA